MTLKTLLPRIAVCATFAWAAAAANADTYQFTLSGDYTASWQMASSPTPDLFDPGLWFALQDVPGFATSSGVAEVLFSSAANGGGMYLFAIPESFFVDATGPQLYTGPEGAPTFKLGSFALTDYNGLDNYTLTITNVSAVPEPATLALLLAGLGVVGATVVRRQGSQAAAG